MNVTPGLPPNGESPAAWNLRRAEELLSGLVGIISARIVANRAGEIEEIHVLTTAEVQPKQVVRNVESALMAQLGINVDHRKISVAQTAAVLPMEVLERGAVEAAATRRKVLFGDMAIESPRSHRVRVRVALRNGDSVLEGVEEGVDDPGNRLQVAARAAVRALEGSVSEGGIVGVVLEGVKLVEAFDRRYVLAAVHGVGPRSRELLVGMCEVRDGPEQAAVLAVLDATNRWMFMRA